MNPTVIIGGGPAGATLGCYLSMAGIENIIIEKANHPRPHVGESLVNTTTRTFKEIGFLEVMERVGFLKKHGAVWHAPNGTGTTGLKFKDMVPLKGVTQDYTYHVDRAQMDMLLLKHAEEKGSRLLQGVGVRRVIFDDAGQAVGVEADVAGRRVEIDASVVVDASGRKAILGRQLKWLQKDEMFEQFCIHAWFTGVDRGPVETTDDIHIFFLPIRRSWVWQIPVTDEITSIGLVLSREDFDKDIEGCFERYVSSSVDVARAMKGAARANDFKAEGDYSYCMERFCGDGFMLIGDAARFVDPIFSSGVGVAMHSAKLAASSITDAYQARDFSAKVFEPYEVIQRRGMDIWYEFIRLYYKALPLFTYFIQHPDYRCQLHELLQGDVYDREDAPVLGAMREYIQAIEASENHMLRGHLDHTISLE